MNDVRLFSNPEFGSVRTVVLDGEPWFVGVDVARSLGYKDNYSAFRNNVDEEDKRLCPVNSTSGVQETTVINESGMYSLIFGSRLDKAKGFKRWVTNDVLPSIRKTGSYSITQKKPDSYMIEDKVERAKRWIEEQEEKQLLETRITELEPKAELCDKILDARLLVNFRDAAKEIGISPTQLTGWLDENGYIYRTPGGELRPMENYMSSGLFQLKPYMNPHNGHKGSQTYITGRGLAAFKTLIDGEGHSRYTMKKHGGRNKKCKKGA